MAFELQSFDVMEYLWDLLDKTPDGKHVIYTATDVEQLWAMGFVDAGQISIDDWLSVFEPFRQENGSFLLGRDDFMQLDKYRYKGEVRIPFDAMRINEGKYTDEGLKELFDASIVPSCSLSTEEMHEFFEKLKNEFRQNDGLILIRSPAKERIRALIDANPSPLRNLELMLDQMIGSEEKEIEEEIDRAEEKASKQKELAEASRFTQKPTSRTEQLAQGLKQLEKAKRLSDESAEHEGATKVELKKIRRSRKGTRG